MEKDLQLLLGNKIESIMLRAGCPKCIVLLFPNKISIRTESARATLLAAGDAIEAMLKVAEIQGAQVSVEPNTGTIRVGFASVRYLDRSLRRAIDRGKL